MYMATLIGSIICVAVIITALYEHRLRWTPAQFKHTLLLLLDHDANRVGTYLGESEV